MAKAARMELREAPVPDTADFHRGQFCGWFLGHFFCWGGGEVGDDFHVRFFGGFGERVWKEFFSRRYFK